MLREIQRFFSGRKPISVAPRDAYIQREILPYDFREALKYEGQVGKSEILSLIPYWPNEALYLLLKIWDHDPSQQQLLLKEVVSSSVEEPAPEVSRGILQKWTNLLPENSEPVKAAKLAQISRVGQTEWQRRFAQLAQKSLQQNPQRRPHLIAYAAMTGLWQFVRTYVRNEQQSSLAIVIPEWFEDPQQNSIGYVLQLAPKVGVTPYEKSAPLDPEPHIIDDTARTGNSITHVREFWMKKAGIHIPEEQIFVITDLRQSAQTSTTQ